LSVVLRQSGFSRPEQPPGFSRTFVGATIVMDVGRDTEVLGRLASLDIAIAAYLHVTVKYPLRNVRLCQGEQIIKLHGGEPKPEPPKDPNLIRPFDRRLFALRTLSPPASSAFLIA
jgi:hypothetical protein